MEICEVPEKKVPDETATRLHDALRAQMTAMANKAPTPASMRALSLAATAARDLLTVIESPENLLQYLPGGPENGEGPETAPPAETYGVAMIRQLLPQLQKMMDPSSRPPTMPDLLHMLESAQRTGAPDSVLKSIRDQIAALAGASSADEWKTPPNPFATGFLVGTAAASQVLENESPSKPPQEGVFP